MNSSKPFENSWDKSKKLVDKIFGQDKYKQQEKKDKK
jgi:hypothetical protein